jgi:anthranilate synthase component 1
MKEKITIIRAINDQGVVVTKDLKIDTLTPVQAYHSMVGSGDGFLLESIPGKYSFIGKFCDNGTISIDGSVSNPWEKIKLPGTLKFQEGELPPFIGGYVGYFGYDMVRGIENLPRPKKASGFPDALLGKVDTMLMFDHMRQKVSLLHTIAKPGIGDDTAIAEATQAFSSIEDSLFMNGLGLAVPGASKAKIVSVSIEDSAFIDAIKKAKHYIEEGDIIQTVLSRRIKLDAQADPFTTYRRLRQINPSPYLFYIKLGSITLIGSSPEDMVRLTGDTIATLPIAGTRPRGTSPEEDKRLAEELLKDEKERAEHLMLLDLARNDVGKVAKPATVQVVSSFEIRYYSHVMHIVSCVQGIKKDNLDGIDVLKACFPAGTVSGAPKVRAMEIIDELEGVCRGPYAGAVGYLSFNGNIDTGIAIRTIFRNNNDTYIQAGAGIVWDSKPDMELKEIDNKLKALSVALGDVS